MSLKSAKQRLTFLFPLSVIRGMSFTKKDVKNVKDNVCSNLVIIRLIIAVVFYAIAMLMMIVMNNATGGHQVEVYGLASVIAQIVSMFGTLSTILLIVPALFIKNEKAAIILNRVAAVTLYLGLALQMLFSIYADAGMGFTSQEETLSAGIVLISILILIQPAHWIDAAVLDIGFTASFFALCIYCNSAYGMKALQYYILVGAIFPLCCYFIITLLFYAESQHYKDMMENERLTDKAYYDNLTKCKNRHALTEFIKENSRKWKFMNLLIILFDIDNFKLYNDQFSHLGGDYCLKSIADAVRTEFASPSLDFFRYGGEEFLLFFELEDKNEAPIIMEKVRKAIRNQEIAAPEGAPKDVVTVSLGGLLIERAEAFKFEDELALVDKYLYIAKASGKDVSCYNGELIEN